MAYKTPGVYIEEIAKFPPSVAAVETAIPAFIGHTEKAQDTDQKSLLYKPTKIKSLLDFEELFGGAYEIKSYTVNVTTSTNSIQSVTPDKRFLLYESLRMYFDNGGGDCYIVSIGSYTDALTYNNVTVPASPKGFKPGLNKLFQFDEPTLILFPDAVNLKDSTNPDYVSFGSLQSDALKQCYDLKDRFVIMDIINGFDEDDMSDELENFRTHVGTQNLKYGAAYYPWIKTNYEPSIKLSQLKFVEGTTPITNYTGFSGGDSTLEALVTRAVNVSGNVNTLITNMEANTVDLDFVRGQQQVDNYLTDIKKLLIAATAPKTNFTLYMDTLANIATLFAKLDGNVEDELQTEIDRLKEDTNLITAITQLVAMEKHSGIAAQLTATRSINTIYASLDDDTWVNADNFGDVDANTDTITGTNLPLAYITAISSAKTQLVTTFNSFYSIAQFHESLAEKDLFEGHTFFTGVYDRIVDQMSLLPPSGAIAGVFCSVDSTRGVWKAPANVSLSNTVAPAMKITDNEQSSLNVHTTGKSINCIRSFVGKGITVWGARTLAGNDNEWRYVSVRRFFNMVEESVKKSTEKFVFEPNDANTWVKVKAMIENFLLLQWRQGALAGAKPEQAFYVKVGLSETMTSLDILEGRMIVEIGMAVVRPAEFIVLKFSHKMQEA